MLKEQVLKHFGGAAAAARALGMTVSAVSQWKDKIPRGAAYIVESVTDGQLRVDPSQYPPKRYKQGNN